MTQTKKIPTRRCTSCGEHFPKSELFRVVRSPEGEISLDKVGKASGRGAYICKNAACFRKARKSGRIATALECAIPDWVYEKIEEELEVGN
jgi:predicted RNA-binding protein YlxR (DUF448 family)